MPQKRGSQTRYSLLEMGLTVVDRRGKNSVILEDEDGHRELYSRNDTFAGAVVVIGRTGYEFVRSVQPSVQPWPKKDSTHVPGDN